MKIPNNSIEQWLNKPAPDVYGALIYGPDAGLVSARAMQLEKSVCKDEESNRSLFDVKRLKDEPYILNDAMQSLSLLGGKPIIKIQDSTASIPKPIQDSLSTTPSNGAFIIWCADELSPSSSVRKFFEQTKHIVAIPCYKDDEQHIQLLIAKTLNEAGYRYERDVPLTLSQKFYGDRLVIMSELNKLMLYTQESKTITAQDAEICVNNSQELALSSICNAVAERNLTHIHHHLNAAYAEGMTAVAIIRVLTQYFLKIHHVKHLMAAGAPFQEAAKKIRPPIFFKQLPLFQRHVNQWNSGSLFQVLSYLNDLEIHCKKNHVTPTLLLEYFTTKLTIKKAAS